MEDVNFIKFPKNELIFDLTESLVSPFEKEIHPLAKLASQKLQNYISDKAKTDTRFILNHGNKTKKIGKMFGVLVVKNQKGELGYLQAFSGKLGDSNHHDKFVPPIFDLLDPQNFFNLGMTEITVLTKEINDFKTSQGFERIKTEYNLVNQEVEQKLSRLKNQKTVLKQNRKKARQLAEQNLKGDDLSLVLNNLAKQSIETKAVFKELENNLKATLQNSNTKYQNYTTHLSEMIENRKNKSSNLQQLLFDEYQFLNQKGEKQLLRTIFNDPKGNKMPAGAGECSAPKLFQYAFKNNYTPLALAEFWWGKSPKSENKVHKQFYPPCTDKCVPILGFMLGE